MITEEQIHEFCENGYVVVDNVLTAEQVQRARACLHEDIYRHTGVQHMGDNWSDVGARLKGPANKINYAKWKLLDIHLHPNSVFSYRKLLQATYGAGTTPGFEHPFGPCYDFFCFVDRICYRLPDSVRAEGGLSLHLDRNPLDPYLTQAGGLARWRPIQSFICLTDHFDNESGGLKVVPGFHHCIDHYFNGNIEAEAACGSGGEFFRMHGKSHAKIQKQLQTVHAPAGSLVLWDSRLPHSTCEFLSGYDTREVVYSGFLPDVPINRFYVEEQKEKIARNAYPRYGPQEVSADRDWEPVELSGEQQQLLGYLL